MSVATEPAVRVRVDHNGKPIPEAEPKYATPRRPERPTIGGRIAQRAYELGWDPMPHQRMKWDVAGEYDPDTGRLFYRNVISSQPRQSGKTVDLLVPMVDRCTMWPNDPDPLLPARSWGPQNVIYSEKKGGTARRKLLRALLPVLEKFCPEFEYETRSNDNTSLAFRNGSIIQVLNKGEDEAHGDTIHMAGIDEAFVHTDDSREQGIRPAMQTIDDAQLWDQSTAGKGKSTYWSRKLALGRQAVLEGWDRDVCFFEWAADDDRDLLDPEHLYSFHPALGHTVTLETLLTDMRALPEGGPDGGIIRAYGNIQSGGSDLIPKEVWQAVCEAGVSPAPTFTYGVAALPDGVSAAVGVSDSRGRCELLKHAQGIGWAVDYCNELTERNPGRVVLDGGGPAKSLAGKIKGCREDRKDRLSGGEVMEACSRFWTAVTERQGLQVRSHPDLDLAVKGLVKKQIGDNFVWSRQGSLNDVTPLEAVTLAWHVATSGPAYQKPMGAAR